MTPHDDDLSRAVTALRTVADGSSPQVDASRRRILTRARTPRPKHRVARVLLPLAATFFVVSGAWRAVSGRLPNWMRALNLPLLFETNPSEGGRATERRAPSVPPTTPPSTEPTAERSALSGVPDVPCDEVSRETTEQERTVTPGNPPTMDGLRGARLSPRTAPSPSRPPEISSAERTAYRKGHTAHFVQHDAAAAVRAWDAYLADFPTGAFALEARYNRAISLLRLGRRQEARSALEPFSNGTFGGYRRAEARTLISAMADSPPR